MNETPPEDPDDPWFDRFAGLVIAAMITAVLVLTVMTVLVGCDFNYYDDLPTLPTTTTLTQTLGGTDADL